MGDAHVGQAKRRKTINKVKRISRDERASLWEWDSIKAMIYISFPYVSDSKRAHGDCNREGTARPFQFSNMRAVERLEFSMDGINPHDGISKHVIYNFYITKKTDNLPNPVPQPHCCFEV